MIVSAVTALLWTAAPAAAHATVVSSAPADGTRLQTSPAVLTFDLNEPVTLVDGSAQLIDVDGTRYPLAGQRLESGRQRILLPLNAKLPDGAYLATARVVSADTHVVSLSIRFTVGSVTEQGQWSQVDGASAVDRAVLLPIKIVVYLGTVGSAGLLLAARWAWPDIQGTHRFRITYRIGAAVLILGLLGRLVVLAVEQSGSVADISWEAATTIAGTPFGIALLVAVVLSLVALFRPAVLGLVQAAAAIAAVTLGGHGGSSGWSFVATFVHIYGVAVWLGGVTLIALVDRSVPQRWHRVAVAHVGLAAAAGVVLAVLQIRPLAALTSTSYGVTLLVKISLVTATVVAGYLVYRAARRHFPGRAVLAETVLALLVVGVTSSLSSLTPARASYTTNVAVRLDFGGPDVLDVDIDTVRRGSQVVTVRDPDGSPGAQVGLELSSAQANVARLPVELSQDRATGDAVTWRSTGLIVPAPGRWKATIRFDNGSGPKLASFFYQVL
ncbi:copper resistance protein CopC [Mycolicibacterium septicum]|uniref:copper resistance CopC/CopD family protein n=1 Tax=Mycolicibacterium septicum TaxID=98668 RepID=UPI0023E1CC29|nr:copper resistance protein CopC [Mycolicibacterium septicum]MDF3336383.1 copper resistance protein CopC [Mycolicibacterium septicum]